MGTLARDYSPCSAEELVRACVSCDNEEAWAEFVRRFRPVIARVVLRTSQRWIYPDRQLLDDLIQDAFLRLCTDNALVLRRFRPTHKDSIFGFVKSVAASVVYDHFKFEKAQKRDADRTESLSDKVCVMATPGQRENARRLEDKVALRQIDETIWRLFQGENFVRNRAIFWLHHRDGMTASAIAAIPSIGLNTKGVESALRRMTQMIHSHIREAV